MKVKIGDRVRFLNEEGGGRVARVEGHMVYVEDEDGFQIPVMDNDAIVVDEAEHKMQGEAYSRAVRNAAASVRKAEAPRPLPEGASWRARVEAGMEAADDEEEEVEPPAPQATRTKPGQPDDRPTAYAFDADATDDANPHFYLALTQAGGGNTGSVDLHVVNDSNYFASYAILRTDAKGQSTLIAAATIEPNTKERVDTLNPMQVDGQTWQVQLLMFKKIRSFAAQPVYNAVLKPRGVRLVRGGSYADNDFFDEKAILLPVIKDEFAQKLEQLSDKEVARSAAEGRRPEAQKVSKPSRTADLLEVDLHIDALLPDTRGLENKDMLEAQMAHVRTVMEQNAGRKGLRIVFIHGVGAGVLKGELRSFLERKYPKSHFQDASFREYGFGATMVTL